MLLFQALDEMVNELNIMKIRLTSTFFDSGFSGHSATKLLVCQKSYAFLSMPKTAYLQPKGLSFAVFVHNHEKLENFLSLYGANRDEKRVVSTSPEREEYFSEVVHYREILENRGVWRR